MRLEEKHVEHLKISASAVLERHGSEAVVAVALPPLVCVERYHYAHLDVQAGTLKYRGATSVEYPRTVGAVLEADVVEDGRYYATEAVAYAQTHWGGELRSPEVVGITSRVEAAGQGWVVLAADSSVFETECRVEALEYLYGKSDGAAFGRKATCA